MKLNLATTVALSSFFLHSFAHTGDGIRPWDDDCIGLIEDIQYGEGSQNLSETNLVCEIASGEMFNVDISSDWIEEQVAEGSLVSGATELTFPDNTVFDEASGQIAMAGEMPQFSMIPPTRRKLATVEGKVTVLVVHVKASDKSTTASKTALASSVFGNGFDRDPVNLKSQYEACSHGKLKLSEATDRDGKGGVQIRKGSTSIMVNVSTIEGDKKMRNAITNELNRVFEVNKPNELATHVMYCLPPGTMVGVAYASVNSWNSVYNDEWCRKVSAQMHEIGHNLNLAHSNENGSYKDQSGMMGYSYNQDNSPRMCFNSAKSWQLGWYQNRHIVVSPSHPSYIGELGTIVENPDVPGPPMLVKIVTSTGKDYFMNFNYQGNFNLETKEGGDQVLITRAGDGTAYAESELKAKLASGQTYTVNNFDRDGNTLSVEVISIQVSTRIANVRVCLGSCNQPPKSPRTSEPTRSPRNWNPTGTPRTTNPTRSPRTSNPTGSPRTLKPTRSPSRHITERPTQAPVEEDNGVCSDERLFLYNGSERNCEWILSTGRCARKFAENNCRLTCGHCVPKDDKKFCQDKKGWFSEMNNSRKKSCKWVEKHLARCSLVAADDPSKTLADLCPVTCRLDCKCFDDESFSCDWIKSKGRCNRVPARAMCPVTCGRDCS